MKVMTYPAKLGEPGMSNLDGVIVAGLAYYILKRLAALKAVTAP